ncbi:MAG TPA: EAL domain-containing protein [Pyrinomonadaceae bacterium]|nr:EAL domain-containing protein [Pyrinomonadaceae bacterium]
MNNLENAPVRVLLVDDDEDDYVLTKYLFEEFKDNRYELEWASGYDEALHDMQEGKHDIYLVDYRLGAENGLELLQRAIKAGCSAPIILLTGQGDKEVDMKAMQAGAADYLVKGQFEAPLLERSIRYSLQHAHSMEKLLYEALHDSLTGLPNRVKFTELLSEAIQNSQRLSSSRFAVLFLDLDRFKIINDSLGHFLGDKLLQTVSDRLKKYLRPHDSVARFGGDEFTILLNNIKERENVIEISDRLQREISIPFKIDGHEIFTSASIGITFFDSRYERPEDLLRDADTAMYQAKLAGKAQCKIFEPEMHITNLNLLQIENDMRRAIERNEFKVYYQPIVNLESQTISEFESLIRWHHPEQGLVSPIDFIPLAEETGLIVSIGKWVLAESCRQIVQWQEQMVSPIPLSVSVNLSAKQLMHSDIAAQIKEIIIETGINPRSLKLEVTESVVMENAEVALQILSELCALGVRISSDDFGTGYSSLSYLHRFPFDRLKIDRSFVTKMDQDSKSEEIVRSIILLAKNLKMEVVAEGIENEKQYQQLYELGCKLGQGFLFSRPIPKEGIEDLLKNGIPHILQPNWTEKHEIFNSPDAIELAIVQ